MSPFAQTFTSQHTTNQRTFRVWIQTNLPLLNSLSFIMIVTLCLIYIVQVNQTVTKGYQIRDLESQIHDLTLMNQKLEVITQQAQSLENIERATKMIGLVRADQPEYITSQEPSYALAE